MIEPESRGVLDTPAFAGYDDLLWSSAVHCFTPGMTQDYFPAFATAFSIRRASTAQ